jgi:hypothetical protein
MEGGRDCKALPGIAWGAARDPTWIFFVLLSVVQGALRPSDKKPREITQRPAFISEKRVMPPPTPLYLSLFLSFLTLTPPPVM